MELPILREALYERASSREIGKYELGDRLDSGNGPYIAVRHDGNVVISCYKDPRLGAMGNTVKVSVRARADETPRDWTMNPLFNDSLRDDEEILALFEYVVRSVGRMSPERANRWCRDEGFN